MINPNIDEIWKEVRFLKRKLKTSEYVHLEAENEKALKSSIVKELYNLNQILEREQGVLVKVMHLLRKEAAFPIHICPSCGDVRRGDEPLLILCPSCYAALEEKPILKIKIPEEPCDKLESSEVKDVKK